MGTVMRLAALKVLEQLLPDEMVTICLPLFLAGGEADRAFARFYPTIAIDGCEKLCAARGTEMHSGKPAASIIVIDFIPNDHLGTARRINQAGKRTVETIAGQVARKADELLGAIDREYAAFCREQRRWRAPRRTTPLSPGKANTGATSNWATGQR
jgi:hypothetical protein